MKTEELRIGNIVRFKQNSKIAIIKEIDELGVKVLFQDGEFVWIEISEIEPIQLTEEWILKLGYKKFTTCRYKHKALIGFHITKGIGYYMTYVSEELLYVHQLQNLFFSITNEELEVK